MKLLILMVVVALTFALQAMGHLRTKRSVLQFGSMIACETGRSRLDYLGYGCWCGPGGNGIPVDSVDWCCYNHDNCYDNAKGKCKSSIYYTGYHRVGCSDCDSSLNTPCQQALCKCDGEAARCFRNSYFYQKYKFYSQLKC